MLAKDYNIIFSMPGQQRNWEYYLKDTSLPTDVIDDIVKEVVLPHLREILMSHPNTSAESAVYILNKTKKEDHVHMMEIYIKSKKKLNKIDWIKFKRFTNAPFKFNKSLIELLKKDDDLFDTQKLDIIFNSLTESNNNLLYLVEVIANHKNFDSDILEGKLIDLLKSHTESILFPRFKKSKHAESIFAKMFELTSNVVWLPQEAKDIFVF